MLFPPELRDLVIDCLRTDTAALRACSLTCKAWLPRARHHLFRTVQIQPGRRGDAFKVLLDTSPDIGQHIREVVISGVGYDSLLNGLPGTWPTLGAATVRPSLTLGSVELRSAEWLKSILPASTKVLSRVTSLKLISLPITYPFAEVLGAHFNRVVVVKLDTCRAETFGDLLTLPRGLPLVESLYMDRVTWYRPTYPKPGTNVVSRPNSLKSLTLTARIDAATVINWLVDQQQYTVLSSLSVYLSSDSSASAVRLLLEAVGPSLLHLSIGFSDVRDPTVVLQNANFSLHPLTGLRSLHMQCINTTRFSTLPSLSWILILLSKTNSRHLTTITFTIAHSDLKEKMNLEGLSVVLSHNRYSALQEVVFEVDAKSGQLDDLKERLHTRLSSLADKGVQISIHVSGKVQ